MATSSATLPTAAVMTAAVHAREPDYDENGVDLSLVRYSLSLTPTERLKAIENFMNAMASVRSVPTLSDSERTK
jgi:hypothetical protein